MVPRGKALSTISCKLRSLVVTHLGASIDFISLFRLQVYPEDMEHESVFEGSSDLRQLPEYRHDNLKSVEIIGNVIQSSSRT